MAKDIKFDVEARNGLKTGVDKLANAVKVTFAPIQAMTLIQKVTTYWFVTNIETLLKMQNF